MICFGVARETGFGHVLVGCELLVEDLELGVVGGGVRLGPGVGSLYGPLVAERISRRCLSLDG
jgi:hypothetical protein